MRYKFRAWLKKEYYSVLNPENKIYRVENLDFDKNEAYLSECGWYDFDDIELMQYTGLKDKNGVEIYEGDILLNWEEETFVVMWNDGYGRFELNYGNYEVDLEHTNISSYKIIGNIYENKELLNE